MRYMLLIHSDERVYPEMSEKQVGELLAAYGKFQEAVDKAGVYLIYLFLHSARAELLRRVGRREEARAAYLRAFDLAGNAAERRFLLRRLDAVSGPADGSP